MKKLMIFILGLGLAFAASAATKPITGTFVEGVHYCEEATPGTFVATMPNVVLVGKERWLKCAPAGDSTVTVHSHTTGEWSLPVGCVICYRQGMKQERQFACSKSTMTGVITCISNHNTTEIMCP